MENCKKQVLIVGNPLDGFDVYGPFPISEYEYSEEANDFATIHKFDYWWVVPLNDPEDEENDD